MHQQLHQILNEPHSAAINDYHRARMKASLQQIAATLTGKPIELLSYEDVAQRLGVTGSVARGLRSIPLKAVVGSVGRYTDFTRTFLPLSGVDPDRWASVMLAAGSVSQLPPIEVYKIDEAYFVLDGNHRVSIARQQGVTHLDAYVTEVRTRVPLPSDVQPDELIIRAEYARFLQATRLDQLRPGADLIVSVPGQYVRLENHIEVHRYFLEEAQERELGYEEAVCSWYDDAYLPMVTAIREQGILRYFPARTETDFYVWLATHQAAIRNELGWQVRPETITQFACRVEPKPERAAVRAGRQLLDIVVPRRWKSSPKQDTWSNKMLLARYSEHLFADILVPLGSWDGECRALEQALVVAHREQAQVHGLLVVGDERDVTGHVVRIARREFRRRCQTAGIQAQMTVEVGQIMDRLCQRSVLADLIVLDRDCPDSQGDMSFGSVNFGAALRRCSRPILVVVDQPSEMSRVLLACGGNPEDREALFVAVYLAEAWDVELVVLEALEPGQSESGFISHAHDYLDLHEVEAKCLVRHGQAADVILATAAAQGSNLIITGGRGLERGGTRTKDSTVNKVLRESREPVLVCL